MRTIKVFLALFLLLGARLSAGEAAARVKGQFRLVDARTGQSLRSFQLRGKVQWVFFGFTHCAATCPVGLSRLRDALQLMGADAVHVAPIFITTDPKRDDAKVMREYAANFSPEIIPLVGSKKAVAEAMRSFRLEAEKTAIESDQVYQMDHPAILYLMDTHGRFLKSLPSSGPATELAKQTRLALAKP